MFSLKKTKNALISSALAIVMTVSMLVGTTFAWFTDSVTFANNIIQAGSLDAAMYWADGAKDVPTDATGWQDASKGAIFDYDKLEPGFVQARHIKISNEGSLDFKYRINIVAIGEVSDLAKVIDVYYVDPAVNFGSRVALVDDYKLGTLADVLGNLASTDSTAQGVLKGGTSDTITLALRMQESAGNEYMNKSIGSSFQVQLLATQTDSEFDSFDNQYDKDSAYPEMPESFVLPGSATFDEFAQLLEKDSIIYLSESMTLMNPASGRTDLVIDGDVDLYLADDATLNFGEVTVLSGDGTLTVHGGKLKTLTELCTSGNSTLVIEDGVHDFASFSATGNGSIIVNGGTINLHATYAGIMSVSFGETGSLIVNDGVINLAQPINLNANRCDAAYVEINGGIINMGINADNLFVTRNIMDKDRESGVLRGSSIKITGGEFHTTYQLDYAGDANSLIRNGDDPADANKVLVSNTFNGNPDYNCVVTGGTFYGCWKRSDNSRYTEANGNGHSDGQVYENTISGFVPAGYVMTGDEVNGYVVSAQ